MPFFGVVHIAYIPDGKVTGLSKLSRTVEVFARRLQMQERMTAQIADAIMDELKCEGAMVVIEAEHMCMTMRGVPSVGIWQSNVPTLGGVSSWQSNVPTLGSVGSYSKLKLSPSMGRKTP